MKYVACVFVVRASSVISYAPCKCVQMANACRRRRLTRDDDRQCRFIFHRTSSKRDSIIIYRRSAKNNEALPCHPCRRRDDGNHCLYTQLSQERSVDIGVIHRQECRLWSLVNFCDDPCERYVSDIVVLSTRHIVLNKL